MIEITPISFYVYRISDFVVIFISNLCIFHPYSVFLSDRQPRKRKTAGFIIIIIKVIIIIIFFHIAFSFGSSAEECFPFPRPTI